jgi:ABC-type protease/lipase transport system fused ATPase/permease subunit
MRHMVNGRIVEVFAEADGSMESAAVLQAAGIPEDRELILQLPDGSNQILNPGENVTLSPNQFFRDAPKHKRGFAATDTQHVLPAYD